MTQKSHFLEKLLVPGIGVGVFVWYMNTILRNNRLNEKKKEIQSNKEMKSNLVKEQKMKSGKEHISGKEHEEHGTDDTLMTNLIYFINNLWFSKRWLGKKFIKISIINILENKSFIKNSEIKIFVQISRNKILFALDFDYIARNEVRKILRIDFHKPQMEL